MTERARLCPNCGRETMLAPMGSITLCRRRVLGRKEHIAEPGDVVFRHACKLEFEGIVSKRLGSRYRSGRTPDWLKMKNPAAPAVKREAEEDWISESRMGYRLMERP